MSLLTDLLADSGLGDDEVGHLRLLLADWQILADLSFADLLLFVQLHTDAGRTYVCAGQMRAYTAQTIYAEDLFGQTFAPGSRPMVGRAYAERRVIRDTDPDWSTGVPVREEAIPVVHAGEVIAVVTREANVSTARSPSQLELTYLQSAGELAQMLADGTFPYPLEPAPDPGVSIRVGDGIVRVDGEGRAVYASPNAISAYRRLGSLDHIIGRPLEDFDPGAAVLLDGLRDARSVRDEVDRDGTVVLRRVLPLVRDGTVRAGLLVVREVTDLRRSERALRVKEATIREIHHRVKNNLQTVASLLRLQARRLQGDEGREALAESVRRISSIALVHETLSEESQGEVPFDRIAGRIVEMLANGLADPDVPVELVMQGEAGDLPAEVATPLALVLTELLQNSLEHAFPPPGPGDGQSQPGGQVRLHFGRSPAALRVTVSDDGVGLPPGRPLETLANLGLRIARMLVESELGGTFTVLEPGAEIAPGLAALDGTTFVLVVPVR